MIFSTSWGDGLTYRRSVEGYSSSHGRFLRDSSLGQGDVFPSAYHRQFYWDAQIGSMDGKTDAMGERRSERRCRDYHLWPYRDGPLVSHFVSHPGIVLELDVQIGEPLNTNAPAEAEALGCFSESPPCVRNFVLQETNKSTIQVRLCQSRTVSSGGGLLPNSVIDILRNAFRLEEDPHP